MNDNNNNNNNNNDHNNNNNNHHNNNNNNNDHNNNPFKLLTDIPLISFVLDLLKTYCKTKDNLSSECFAHDYFETYSNASRFRFAKYKPNDQDLVD